MSSQNNETINDPQSIKLETDVNICEYLTQNNMKLNIGNGKMEYIKDEEERKMLSNAWLAITETNKWDFMTENIVSFTFSDNPNVTEISKKMEELGYDSHSGTSFGYVMRLMQYLVKNGEEEFKRICLQQSVDKTSDEIEYKKFFEYSGGF